MRPQWHTNRQGRDSGRDVTAARPAYIHGPCEREREFFGRIEENISESKSRGFSLILCYHSSRESVMTEAKVDDKTVLQHSLQTLVNYLIAKRLIACVNVSLSQSPAASSENEAATLCLFPPWTH